MTVPQLDGLYPGISESDYHGDKDSLSSSGARELLSSSPEEFWDLINQPPKPKPEYDFGHAAHKMVLGEGGQLVWVDAPDWRTKAAQKQRDEAHAAGAAPLLVKQREQAEAMARKVRQHRLAGPLLDGCRAELSGWWTDPETGARLRFRPDAIPVELPGRRPMVVDYKTTTSANPEKFEKSAGDFGYHMQGAWYLEGLQAVTGITDAVFVLIAQSKKPPSYAVSVNHFALEDLVRGHMQNHRAIRRYAQCRQTGVWPGYEGLNELRLSTYARRQIDLENAIESEMQ